MDRISISVAVKSGFRVVRREWRAVLVWSALSVVAGLLPVVSMFGGPEGFLAYYQEMARVGAGLADRESLEAIQADILMRQWVVFPITLTWLIVLAGAVYRTVLAPDDRRFFYLRLSRQELWLVLSSVALMVLIFLIYLGVIIAGAVLGVLGAFLLPQWLTAVIAVLLIIAGLVVVVWAIVRLSLGPIMAFQERRFRLLESWRRTRGHAWRIFLVLLSVWAISFVAQLALLAVLLGVMIGIVGGDALLNAPPEELRGPGLLLLGLLSPLMLVIGMTLNVVVFAPLADIYRQLTAAPEEPVAA